MHRQLSQRERHILEAKEFTKEMGGTDTDVKQWFFNLGPTAFRKIMQEYGRRHGDLRRSYAEEAMPHWRSGQRRMSGMVAKRLFSLLPPHMPISERLSLVESLWKFYAPKRRAVVRYGLNAPPPDVEAAVKLYFDKNASGHDIPSNFVVRFKWLAANDSVVHQKLLNRFLELDRARAATAAAEVAAVIQRHIAAGNNLDHFNQTITVDGLQLSLQCDPALGGVRVSTENQPTRPIAPTPTPKQRPTKVSRAAESGGCFTVIMAAVILGLVVVL
jgi:hypothetical protein